MSISLTIANQTYNYASPGDNPNWGPDNTDWASAVTTAISTITGSGDIATTGALIANNQSSPANVVGLLFDTATIRGAVITYSVYRVTSSAEVVEVGTMYAAYKSTAATWDLAIVGGTGANVTFTITSLGQVQFVSDNMGGTGYTGIIRFRASTLPQ